MAQKAIHQAQTPSQLTKAQPVHSSSSSPAHYSLNFSLPHKGAFWNNLKKRGKNGSQAPFSLLSWHGAQGTEEETFPRQKSSFQSYNNHDKSWFSPLTNR
jgi:hypothetical protein